jgi:hypothetical protein
MATYYGFNPPFLGGPEGVLSRQEDDRLIKNDILQLLLTVPGERVMRPDFGVNLRNHVFEQGTEADVQILRSEIINQIEAQEPRVLINFVDIEPNFDNNGIMIKISLSLKKDPRRQLTIERFINTINGV